MLNTKNLLPPPAQTDWAFFLDVDGTLFDIAPTPNDVRMDRALAGLLERLYHASGGALALVSGRALSDLDRLLGSLAMPRAGQHGLERRDATGRLWLNSVPPEIKHRIKDALAPVLERHPALMLEDKGFTLALHYRQAPTLASHAHRVMGQLVAEAGSGLRLQAGKRVVEVTLADVDKGTAVARYLEEAPFRGRRPVFVGDDANDEHAFAVLNEVDGITIKVGKAASLARYRLPDVAAVRAWLAAGLDRR
jgi:trehalose 6-phosphate phosphatase